MTIENPKQIVLTLATTAGFSFCAWLGNNLLEGSEQKGYNKAKSELHEGYNEALRDAITYRALYDVCCTGADSTGR